MLRPRPALPPCLASKFTADRQLSFPLPPLAGGLAGGEGRVRGPMRQFAGTTHLTLPGAIARGPSLSPLKPLKGGEGYRRVLESDCGLRQAVAKYSRTR